MNSLAVTECFTVSEQSVGSWAKVVGWLRSVRQQLMKHMLFNVKNVLEQGFIGFRDVFS